MARRRRALASIVAMVGLVHVVPITPAHAAGGDISISVYGDLGACADASFNDRQVQAAGALSGVGVGTTFNSGIPATIGGGDNAASSNSDQLPTMCIPGDPTVNFGEITYTATATGIGQDGLLTVLTVTVQCVYTQLGSVVCTPPVKASFPVP